MLTTAESAKKIRQEIKTKLGYTSRQVSVKSDNYSMGSSINLSIKCKEAIYKKSEIGAIAKKEESIDRDNATGEILSGGNTFIHVGIDWELKESIIDAEREDVKKIIEKSSQDEGLTCSYKGTDFFCKDKGFYVPGENSGRHMFENEIESFLIMNQFKNGYKPEKAEVIMLDDVRKTEKEEEKKEAPEFGRMVIRELEVRYSGKNTEIIKVSSPEAVHKTVLPFYENQCKEIFSILCVDNKNNIQSFQKISIGTISEAIVHPREVFQGAVLSNSAAVIMVHNHPSGVLTPSREDILTTKRLVEAGIIMGIPVLDHVIISDNSYYSLKESGDMD